MNNITVKLHWVQTQSTDPRYSDTYLIAGSGSHAEPGNHEDGRYYVNESEEYTLPPGYCLARTMDGELAIYDETGRHCILDRHNDCPRLSSSLRVVHLKAVTS